MWSGKRHEGILLIWLNLIICLFLLLGGAALFGLGAALRQLSQAEEETDMALLCQETVETLKYNRRFQKSAAVPEAAERNGKTYTVSVSYESFSESGITLTMAICTVESFSGKRLELRTLLPAAEK